MSNIIQTQIEASKNRWKKLFDEKQTIIESLDMLNPVTQGKEIKQLEAQKKNIENKLIDIDNEISKIEDALKNKFNEEHQKLYNYFLKLPYHKNHKVITEFFKKNIGFKSIVMHISGNSKKIMSPDGDILKFEWFAKHLLYHSIEKSKLEIKILKDINSKYTDESYVFGDWIHKGILNTDASINEKDTFNILMRDLHKHITKRSIIIPIRINKQAHTAKIEKFLNDFWYKITDELTSNEDINSTGNSLVLLVIEDFEDSEDKISINGFKKLDKDTDYIELANKLRIDVDLEYKAFAEWVDNADNFFHYYEEESKEFLKEINDNKENYIPACNTLEGVLEKITPQIFEDLSFSKLIKNIRK